MVTAQCSALPLYLSLALGFLCYGFADPANPADAAAQAPSDAVDLLSVPGQLISNRRGTIQFIYNSQSVIDCSGLSGGCNCVNSTSPPKLYQMIVDVDLPPGSGPFPIVWLWHGFGGPFLLNSRGYNEYVYALNAAGYAVIQYDVIQAFIPILVQDTVELQFPIQVLNWLKFVSQNPESKFYNKFDFSRIAVTGHSRGGKISGYVYGASLLPDVFTYIGIDPVDCACFAPCTSNCYPPAFATLGGKTIATIGATIKGCCNPTPPPDPSCSIVGVPCYGVDYQGFLDGAAPDSKNYVSYAGHAQYAQLCAGFGVCNIAGDIVCGANYSVSAAAVQKQSAAEVVEWVNSRLPGVATSKSEPQTDADGAEGPETASTPDRSPEAFMTDASLRIPINLTEGVDFTYYAYLPPAVWQSSISRPASEDPTVTSFLQHLPSATRALLNPEGAPAIAPIASTMDAVWPESG